MTSHPQRRESDRLIVPMFIVGILLLLIAAGLAGAIILTKGSFTIPVVVMICLFGGGGLLLMPTHRVIAALPFVSRFYRRTDETPAPRPPIHD